jgi:O-antigen/teichoic acid export membrane protein/glycosyltransferase involved in cell wall biosynthesis
MGVTPATTQNRSHWPISILSTVSSVFNMLLPLFLVRVLTTDQVGVFKIFFLYLSLAPGCALTIGFINGLAYWAGKGERGLKAVQATSLVIVASALVFFGLALLLQDQLAAASHLDHSFTLVFAFAVLGAIAAQFFEEAAICTGRIWTGALFYSGFEMMRTAAIVLAAYSYRSLAAVFVAHTCFSLLKAFLGYLYGCRAKLVGVVWDSEVYRELLRYAMPVSIAGIMAIPLVFADQLILSTYISASEFAYYAVGCLSIPPLFILEHAVTRVLIPQMSEAFSAKRPDQAALLYHKAVEELAFLMIPAVGGLMVFAVPIIEILFTREYASAAGYLAIFALNYLTLIVPHDSVPRALGQGDWILKNFLFFSALALLLCLVLTAWAGPFGALAGILLSKGAMRAYGIYYIRRCTSWKLRDFLPLKACLRFLVVTFLLSLLASAAAPLFSDPRWWFLACAPLFALLYFLILIAWKRPVIARTGSAPTVLMLTQYLRVGGLERMILMLSERLTTEQSWKVSVFSYDGLRVAGHSGLIPEFARSGIAVEAMQKGEGFSPRVVFKLIQKILRENVAVIHSHDLGALIYGVFAKLFSPARVKLVHTQHSFVHLGKKRRYRAYEQLFCRLADELVVVSQENKEIYLSLGIPAAKITVIENGVAVPEQLASQAQKRLLRARLLEECRDHPQLEGLSRRAGDCWILCLARVHPVKGQCRAVALWNSLSPEARSQCALLLVGPAEIPEEADRLQELIRAAADRERVLLWGESRTPELWLQACDIYLSCSSWEGLPLAPLEAIGSGVPTVLSAIPGHSFLSPYTSQFPLDRIELGAAAVSRLLAAVGQDQGADHERLARYARWVRENYSLERMAGRYRALYSAGK